MKTQNVKKAARILKKEGIPEDLKRRLHNRGPHIHPRSKRD